MRDIIKYTDLNTKIRAMQGRMLKDEDFKELLGMKSVKDIANYLHSHTYYRQNFEDLDENNIHRGDLEVMLYRAMITDALKIAKHLKGYEQDLFRFVYRKQEMEDLKKMLRAVQSGQSLSTLDKKTLFVSRLSHIDFDLSLKAKNARELVDSLVGTNFYGVLNPLVTVDHQIDLFAASMALDLYYYKQMALDIKRKSSGKNKEILKTAFGLDADFRNMLWIYRSKKYYDIRKEILYTYILPGGHKLKKDQIVQLVEANTAEEVLRLLKKGPYSELVDFDSNHWDNSFYKFYGAKQSHNIRMLPTTIAPIIGYIFIKEIEILNLTTIIEGVRYGVEPSEMAKYLAR